MRAKVINGLKGFYLEHRERIHLLLVEQRTREVCDAYYVDGLTYHQISRALGMDVLEVGGRMLGAVGIMLRYKGELSEGN